MAEAGEGPKPGRLLLEVVGAVVVLAIIWFATGGPSHYAATGGPFIKPLAPVNTGQVYGNLNSPGSSGTGGTISPGSGSNSGNNLNQSIKISAGSAGSAIQPNDEYIYLTNNASIPVSISGWKLQNAGTVTGGSGILRGSQRSAIIPSGVILYRPNQANSLVPIVLAPGARAVVTTGRIPNTSPYAITNSFRTNICTGYFSKLPYYNFKPSLPITCPDATKEPGVATLDDKCYSFIKNMSRCHTPDFKDDRVNGGQTVDGVIGLSASCQNYLKLHYNYVGCTLFHSADSNFNGKEWRIFLNTLPLWSKDRETISLYNLAGQLINSLSY